MARRVLPLLVAISTALGCRTPASRAPVQQGTVKLPGFEVPYVVEGSGRPCIVYGLLEFHRRAFSDRFKRELRCAYVQARFAIAGAPADPAKPFTIDAAVEDLEAVRAALGMDEFVLVGHSIPGTVALAYALRYPQHVTHVIAIGAPPEIGAPLQAASAAYWEKEATPERKALHAKNRAAATDEALARMSPSDAVVADTTADAAKRWYDPERFDEKPLFSMDTWNVPVIKQLAGSEYRLFRGDEKVKPHALLAFGRYDFGVPYTMWDPYRGRFRDLSFALFEESGRTPQMEEAQAFDEAVRVWLSMR